LRDKDFNKEDVPSFDSLFSFFAEGLPYCPPEKTQVGNEVMYINNPKKIIELMFGLESVFFFFFFFFFLNILLHINPPI